MNTQNEKSIIDQQSRGAVFFGLSVSGLVAVVVTMLLCCPLASAETYEVIEDGQIYLVEVTEEVVMASANDPNDPGGISKKYDAIQNNLDKLLDRAINESGDFFKDKQKEKFSKLWKENGRSKKAKERLDDDGGFKKVGKKNDFNKKHKDKDDEINEDISEEFGESLDDLNDALIQADQELEIAIDAKKRYKVLMMSDTRVDKCKDLVDAKDDLRIAAAVLRSLTIVSQTALDCCSATFGQTIGGYNLQALCNIPALCVGACDLAAYGCETADEMASADAEAACMDQLDDMNLLTYDEVVIISDVTEGTAADVNDLSAAVEELNQAIEDLNDRMDDLEKHIDKKFTDLNTKLDIKFKYIETLLKMPQGKREDFPLKE